MSLAYNVIATPYDPVASELVTERFSLAEQYAVDLINKVNEVLAALRNVDLSIDWEVDPWENVGKMGLDGLDKSPPGSVTINEIGVERADFPYPVPSVGDISIDDEDPPPWNVPDPGIDIPDRPSVTWPIYSIQDPQLTDPQVPPVPDDIIIPGPPSLGDISIPGPPEYSIPDFEGILPVDDLTPPTPVFNWEETLYDSDLKDKLSEKLYDNLVQGGTGLDEETEQAIWDRAVSRMMTKEEALYNETLEYFSSRGYTLPPGALSGSLLEIRNAIIQSREDLANDILIQQSKLAQENTHFTMDQARQWEGTLMHFADRVQQRSFEAAKYILEGALLVYRARVDAYTAKLAGYRAMADVYIAQIQGEMAKAELYKAQIAGVQASVEVQKALVDLYRGQLAGVQAQLDLYNTQLAGAKLRSDIDRIKIENFQALVNSFTARINAVTARYEGYKAEISGEVAKAQVFKSQADAYDSQVNAYKAKSDVSIAQAMAEVELVKADVGVFQAVIDKYRADTQRNIAEAETQVKIEGLEIANLEAQTKVYSAELDVTVRTFLGAIEEIKAKVARSAQEAEIAVREGVAKNQAVLENTRALGQFYSQLGAAALSVVSASAHVGFGESRSDNRGYSESVSSQISQSQQYSELIHHYYKHDVE